MIPKSQWFSPLLPQNRTPTPAAKQPEVVQALDPRDWFRPSQVSSPQESQSLDLKGLTPVLTPLSGPLGPVLAHLLDQLRQQPRGEGWDGGQLAEQAQALIQQPDAETSQGSSYSCAAANAQRQLAQQPSLLLEVVQGLSSPQGAAQLPGGAILHCPAESRQDDGSGRNALNRLLQSSLMELASPDGSRGLTPGQVAHLSAALEGQPQSLIVHDSSTHQGVIELLEQAPTSSSFQCGMHLQGRDHMLLFQGQEQGQIHYFDPALSQVLQLPSRDFLFKTEFLVVPHSLSQPHSFPQDKAWLIQP